LNSAIKEIFIRGEASISDGRKRLSLLEVAKRWNNHPKGER